MVADRILVVDDVEANARLLTDILRHHGFTVDQAADGEEAMARIAAQAPDLVLLDVVMPRLDGIEVCQRLRAQAEYAMLPVVLITALDPQTERVRGLDAGADDFLSKPFHVPELLARVRSLLRVKRLYNQVEAQARELRQWSETLEARVAEEVAKNGRLARLKRFLAPQLADLIVAGGAEDPLRSHRREIAVVFIDLRGFTAFAESSEPEIVMRALAAYHEAIGTLIQQHGGTLERFTGDGMMVFFNDPVVIPDPARRAVELALAMRSRAALLAGDWQRHGFDLAAGIGVALGYATLGAIGFAERIDYGAIGTVTNLAARLCTEASEGDILVSQRVHAEIDGAYLTEAMGQVSLHGLRPQLAYRLLGPATSTSLPAVDRSPC